MLARDEMPIETRRGLPGEAEDTQSRYLEAAVKGILIGCLYLPNGNPAPGPKFDYKLGWFARFIAHAADLLASDLPVVLAGDYNVMPTDLDVYKPERWVDDALFRPEVRAAFQQLLVQGWTDAVRYLHPGERLYTCRRAGRILDPCMHCRSENAFACHARPYRVCCLPLLPTSLRGWDFPC